jgi:hypothetical protein
MEGKVMAIPQGGLQPLIGYAMQALGIEGATVDSVEAQMQRIAGDRGWPVSLIQEAISWAIDNRAATLAARTVDASRTLADALGKIIPTGEPVGVRVVFVVSVAGLGLERHYETVSVVINVSPDTSPDQAIQIAAQYWLQTADRNRYGNPVIMTERSPGIVAVFEGGYEIQTGGVA